MPRKPKPSQRWHSRAAQTVRAHPWVTWGTAASIATVLGIAIPGGAWLLSRYETVEAAELHAKEDERKLGQLLYGQQQIQTLLLRNRVNDCRANVKAQQREACRQYEQEYREAARKEQFLFEQMQKGGK